MMKRFAVISLTLIAGCAGPPQPPAAASIGARATITGRAGWIEGAVLDDAGAGLGDADVFLLEASTGYPMVADGDRAVLPMTPGESSHGVFDWWVEGTGAEGHFAFENVPVGSYRIVAQTAHRNRRGDSAAGAVRWNEPADRIHLRGVADDVRIEEGAGAAVTLEPVGSGIYHYDWSAPNDDVYLVMSTGAPVADPVLGFVGWRGPFTQGALCIARMTSGSAYVHGLPEATLHSAVVANDNTPGFWFESVPLMSGEPVRSDARPVAYFSSGRQSPPERLQPLVDHLGSLSKTERSAAVHGATVEGFEALTHEGTPRALRVDEMADYLDSFGPLDRVLPLTNVPFPAGPWTVGDLLAANEYVFLAR